MCREHGVVVVKVPWARHDAGHTYTFDETVAWLATQSSKSTVTQLMRVAWRTVGSIITRVWADVDAQHDRLAGLRRIGIDEISYKRGFKFLMVVVVHDTRRLVWAAPGRTSATVAEFFDLLGEERCAQITHVSADGADFIDTIVAQARAEPKRDRGRPRADAPPRPGSDRAKALRAPATRCGRTPRTSPTINRSSSPESPRPTRNRIGPTSSKKLDA